MGQPHRVLEKKLHELEMQFTELFCPFPNSINPVEHQEKLSKEIEGRVEFLKNLLSIEKECHQQGKPSSHLANLEKTFDGLNTAFRDWIDGGEFVKKDMPEGFAVCSCTRSCFGSEEEENYGVNEGEEPEENIEEEEKEEGLDEEGSGTEESDCFELEIKKDQRVLDVQRIENKEDARVPDVKGFDEENIKGVEKELKGHCRPYVLLLSRILRFAGGAAVVSVVVKAVLSEVFGGYQDGDFLIPT